MPVNELQCECTCKCQLVCQYEYECKYVSVTVPVSVSVNISNFHLGVVPWESPLGYFGELNLGVLPEKLLGCFAEKVLFGASLVCSSRGSSSGKFFYGVLPLEDPLGASQSSPRVFHEDPERSLQNASMSA